MIKSLGIYKNFIGDDKNLLAKVKKCPEIKEFQDTCKPAAAAGAYILNQFG